MTTYIVTVEDEWKTREKRITLRKGGFVVERRISYEVLPALLPDTLIHDMLKELEEIENNKIYSILDGKL